MKIKNIINHYQGMTKKRLERKLDKIIDQYEEEHEDDTTLAEAFFAGAIDGMRQGIWINGIAITLTTAATIVAMMGPKNDKED